MDRRHFFPSRKSQEQQAVIKWSKEKRRQDNQPTGAYPLVPIGLQALGEQCLIAGQDLHTASLSAQKSGLEETKKKKKSNHSANSSNWDRNGKDLRARKKKNNMHSKQ